MSDESRAPLALWSMGLSTLQVYGFGLLYRALFIYL